MIQWLLAGVVLLFAISALRRRSLAGRPLYPQTKAEILIIAVMIIIIYFLAQPLLEYYRSIDKILAP